VIQSSGELLEILYKMGCDNDRDPWWWPQSGSFEVIAGAVLTQNTKWQNVEKALANLQNSDTLNLKDIASMPREKLAGLIKPSGFYNTKAKYLQNLCQNIQSGFGDFTSFCEGVSREWLLGQKGLGEESCDAILNYACYREIFVVDRYTHRLLSACGYEFERYEDIQQWAMETIGGYEEVFADMELAQVYARLHGMIVEYAKEDKKFTKIQEWL